MTKTLNRQSLMIGAAFVAGVAAPGQAHASSLNSFNDIAKNIITGIASLPGLLTGLAYMLGLLLGILGILKIKEHVENPQSAPLKDGLIRLAVGGALFASTIVFESMKDLIGVADGVSAIQLRKIDFNVSN